MKNLILLILMLFFLFACSNIEFSYNKDELNNQLYNKTNINITGDEIPFLNTIVLSSNQALIWDTLVKIKKNNSVEGFGKLFQVN